MNHFEKLKLPFMGIIKNFTGVSCLGMSCFCNAWRFYRDSCRLELKCGTQNILTGFSVESKRAWFLTHLSKISSNIECRRKWRWKEQSPQLKSSVSYTTSGVKNTLILQNLLLLHLYRLALNGRE